MRRKYVGKNVGLRMRGRYSVFSDQPELALAFYELSSSNELVTDSFRFSEWDISSALYSCQRTADFCDWSVTVESVRDDKKVGPFYVNAVGCCRKLYPSSHVFSW